MWELSRGDLFNVKETNGLILTGRFIKMEKDPMTGEEKNIRYFDGMKGCEGVIPHRLIKEVIAYAVH